jgi:hypothetical protein
MYSAKRRMLFYREDQGIDLGTSEYLVFQVLSHDPETLANPRAAFFVDFADHRGADVCTAWHVCRIERP